MQNSPSLYDTLVDVLSQHEKWLERGHLKTPAWMMGVNLTTTGCLEVRDNSHRELFRDYRPQDKCCHNDT
jgi:hypothetical protein